MKSNTVAIIAICFLIIFFTSSIRLLIIGIEINGECFEKIYTSKYGLIGIELLICVYGCDCLVFFNMFHFICKVSNSNNIVRVAGLEAVIGGTLYLWSLIFIFYSSKDCNIEIISLALCYGIIGQFTICMIIGITYYKRSNEILYT
uniref:MARVEL domain-containing protein n=1 Tax=Strongyloides venezuelensis TaxID=75913 RepID=A0A0K0F4G9_STRVS